MTIEAIVFDAYGTIYDAQSVAALAEAAFPGHGDYITQVWRIKQLEYTWLRSLMGRYADFWTVTKDALAYTLATLGLEPDAALLERISASYNTLSPYADARPALEALSDYRLAILSNGSPAMLDALVRDSALDDRISTIISADAAGAFKPDPRCYALVEQRLGVPPTAVLFVSSNGFDVAGAKSFGFRVARIERTPPAALRRELTDGPPIGPSALFKALRSQAEHMGLQPDCVVNSLTALPELAANLFPNVRSTPGQAAAGG